MRSSEENTGHEGVEMPSSVSTKEPAQEPTEVPAEELAKEPAEEPAQDEAVSEAPDKAEDVPSFIVGMGGSAGSLEAFQQFFENMPEDTGMAFVVVSHLDPDQKDMMPEILQRSTRMRVQRIEDGMKARPNNVYVIPPNRDLSILHGSLQLLEPSAPRGLRTPIDFFLRHLAEDQKARGIGIIFSGTGSDGTLGLRSLKERLGVAMVQDADSAKYKGMPESAVNAGLVDYSAPASELPAKLLEYVKHFLIQGRKEPAVEKKAEEALDKVIALVRSETGNDFSLYKKNAILRRVERRMIVHQIGNISQYVRYLQENPYETELLFKELLIGVTSFFRDPEAFDVIKTRAVPSLLERAKEKGILRAWVVGCSTGEEAYSLAMVFLEGLDKAKLNGAVKIQIYATDIDKDAINKARSGLYPAAVAQDVSAERLERFFLKDQDAYKVKKEVRDLIVFAQQNVISDPPFTKVDLLSCRNLLIYLGPELQKKILPLFHYSLNSDGVLFLGPSETIGGFTDLFTPLDNKWKIFTRRDTAISRNVVEFPRSEKFRADKAQSAWREEKASKNVADQAEKIIMERIAPPVVLINRSGDMLYFTRPTGKYLEPPVGKANLNIYAMARKGLRAELGAAIRRASSDKKKVKVSGLKVKTNDHYQAINLTVEPLEEPEAMRGLLMVVFEDVEFVPKKAKPGEKSPSDSRLSEANQEMERELQLMKQQLQSVIEDAETSQEEMKSTNEELQSTNEELQSTNEELNTSREEMQSMNEELNTLNSELQAKNEELSEANDDLNNLLNSTQIPALFLDGRLNIRRFTPQMTEIANLLHSDIDRPITDIAFNLQGEDIAEESRGVLKTLKPKEGTVQVKGGRWYSMRIMPYRTVDNVIDGVVIVFSDITERKKLEESLQNSVSSLKDRTVFSENLIDTLREPLIVLDGDLKVVSANRSFYKMFRTRPEETSGKHLYDLGNRQWDIPALRKLLEEVLPKESMVEDFLVEHDFPGIGEKKMLVNARVMVQSNGKKPLMLMAIEDVTDRLPGGGQELSPLSPKDLAGRDDL